jgi:hypothetical protein
MPTFAMPSYYKWPAYIGNALLLLAGLIIASKNSLLGGGGVAALAGLNLYLVWKLDVFSHEEVWLALEIEKARMREELLALQTKIAEHEKTAPQSSQLKPPTVPGKH